MYQEIYPHSPPHVPNSIGVDKINTSLHCIFITLNMSFVLYSLDKLCSEQTHWHSFLWKNYWWRCWQIKALAICELYWIFTREGGHKVLDCFVIYGPHPQSSPYKNDLAGGEPQVIERMSCEDQTYLPGGPFRPPTIHHEWQSWVCKL